MLDAGLCDHPPVAHQHQLLEGEAAAKLLHHRRQRLGVRGVSLEDLHRHRTALVVREQPDDDLKLVVLAVSGVSPARQRAMQALEVGRSHVVEDQVGFAQMALGQGALDTLLMRQQPVHRFVELVLVHLTEAEEFPQGALARLRSEGARQRQLGAWIQDPAHDHRHAQLALTAALGGDQRVELELLQGAENGGDVAMGLGADDLEGVFEDGDVCGAAQDGAERLELGRRPVGEVAEGAVLDLAVFAVAFAQEDGGRGGAVGDGGDIHAHNL